MVWQIAVYAIGFLILWPCLHWVRQGYRVHKIDAPIPAPRNSFRSPGIASQLFFAFMGFVRDVAIVWGIIALVKWCWLHS